MKYFLFVILFIIGGCGDTATQFGTPEDNNNAVGSQSNYTYQATLNIAEANGGCTGGSFIYISYNNKFYEMSDSSTQTFKNIVQQIYNGNTQYKAFQTGGCHNKYNLGFNGIIKQEMVNKNGGQYLTDTIQVQDYLIH
jgi:hypothetical protein